LKEQLLHFNMTMWVILPINAIQSNGIHNQIKVD